MTPPARTHGPVPLPPRRAAQLHDAQLTAPWDPTAPDLVPPGYRRIEREAPLARRDLDATGEDLLGWRMHGRAGIEVAVESSSEPAPDARPGDPRTGRAHLGDVIELHLGVGPLGVSAPCRILEVIDEPDRRGLTYGTLPGHPESGIERFEVLRAADGALRMRVSGYSRPGSLLVRAGSPLARAVQERITRRYLRALDEL
jgi:uncharacterized protein (UPF0548 family)